MADPPETRPVVGSRLFLDPDQARILALLAVGLMIACLAGSFQTGPPSTKASAVEDRIWVERVIPHRSPSLLGFSSPPRLSQVLPLADPEPGSPAPDRQVYSSCRVFELPPGVPPRVGPLSAAAALTLGRQLDLNLLSALELELLPFIGPSMAGRIALDREENGPFTSLEALTRVPGIGWKTVESIRPYLTNPR